MYFLTRITAFLGRACIGLMFIFTGVEIFFNWREREQYLFDRLCDWLSYLQFNPAAHNFFELLLAWTPLLLILASLLQLAGGALVVLNLKVRLGAFLLILYLLPVTFLFHSFWASPENIKVFQKILFIKNVTILGGLLFVLATGSLHNASSKSPEEGPE